MKRECDVWHTPRIRRATLAISKQASQRGDALKVGNLPSGCEQDGRIRDSVDYSFTKDEWPASDATSNGG